MGFSLLIFVISLFCTSSAEYDVTTQLGVISGRTSPYEVSDSDTIVAEYLGIPYAEPPTGSNRFKPTVAKEPWNDILEAQDYGYICPQDGGYLATQFENYETTYEVYNDTEIAAMQNEDCLYLNIYVPQVNISSSVGDESKFPVMVYIHGGEYVAGAGLAYSGVILASIYNVIVVTINYRLGALGFLASDYDGFEGNYGIMDQQMALEWVQDNIEAFNGDPNLVTIFGQGAGASSVHLHTITDMSAGLFSNAIIQSATYDNGLITQESAVEKYNVFISLLSNDSASNDVTQQLQDTAWEDILAQSKMISWAPSLGSGLFINNPRDEMKNATYNKDINILIGSNILDGYPLALSQINIGQQTSYRDVVTDVTDRSAQLYNWTSEDIDKRLEMFPMFYSGFGANINDESATQKLKLMAEIYTDQIYESWAQEVASTQTYVCNCTVFKYHFKRNPDTITLIGNLQWQAANAFHGSELTYVFGFITDPLKGSLQGDIDLSLQMMTYWTNFARTGIVDESITSQWSSFQTFSDNEPENLCRQSLLLDVSADGGSVLLSQDSDKETARTWDFWQEYYAIMGLSCYESETIDPHTDFLTEPVIECEPGVWSDSGVVMSNETAGILLIVFIVLTGFFLLAFLFSCHRFRKMEKKIKKLRADDDSSVHSNAMTTM